MPIVYRFGDWLVEPSRNRLSTGIDSQMVSPYGIDAPICQDTRSGGLDGRILWSHPHPNDLGLNNSMPLSGDDNLVFASSGYGGGSRMLRLTQPDGEPAVEEAWFNNRMRLHFGNAVRIGDLIVGSSGDFGPAFLMAVHVRTGEEAWRDRSFARANTLYADGKLVIVDEDGEVAVASVSENGLRVHARHQVLTENAWTRPSLVGSTLYVRDRHDIVALDLGE